MIEQLNIRKAHEGDVVELVVDYPKYNLRKGQRGVVIAEFSEPSEAYDLEVEDPQGNFLGFAYSVKPEHFTNLSHDALQKGILLLFDGDVYGAWRELGRAVELRPGLIGTAHNIIMKAYADTGDWQSAIFCLRLLLEIDPEYEQARENLASAYLNFGVELARQGALEDSLLLFMRASGVKASEEVVRKIQENFAATYNNLGVRAFQREDYEALRGFMKQACTYNPTEATRRNLAVACIHVARSHIKRNDYKSAVVAFEEAEEAGLISPDFINDYAICLVLLNRIDDAKRAFERALSLVPGDPAIQSNLNRVLNAPTGVPVSVEKQEFDFVSNENMYSIVPMELVAQSMQHAAVA